MLVAAAAAVLVAAAAAVLVAAAAPPAALVVLVFFFPSLSEKVFRLRFLHCPCKQWSSLRLLVHRLNTATASFLGPQALVPHLSVLPAFPNRVDGNPGDRACNVVQVYPPSSRNTPLHMTGKCHGYQNCLYKNVFVHRHPLVCDINVPQPGQCLLQCRH